MSGSLLCSMSVPLNSRQRKRWAGRPCHVPAAMLLAMMIVGCQTSTGDVKPAARSATRPASLSDVIDRFEIDDRLTLCHVWQTPGGKLAGFVEMPQYRDVLKAHGFDVSGVKLLPEESSTGDRFGIVRADHVILRETPEDQPGNRDNVSDLTYGELVLILDRNEDGSTLVHASDGYLGWMEPTALEIVDPGRAIAAATTRPVREVLTSDSARAKRAVAAAATAASIGEARAVSDELTRLLVLEEAREMLGTPYVWGGKTKSGIDCSGLVQTSFARHGILLPRDADQQANVGRLVATRWFTDALLPGDLLFFISPRRGNVSHVAIYLGAGKYIEAGGKDVHISSLTPGDEGYDAKRAATFGWARRVIE